MARVHLPVGVELDDDLGAVRQSSGITVLHRPSDPEIAPVVENDDSRVGIVPQRSLAGGVGAAVVNDVNQLHLGPDAAQYRADRRGGSKGGDDDGESWGAVRNWGWIDSIFGTQLVMALHSQPPRRTP